MKTIQEVYPGLRPGWAFGPYDYAPLLESLGTAVVRVDQEDYQGDSWVLFRDGDSFGYLQFGWGSCSGCDALQACGSYEELEELRRQLAASIRWGTREELVAYLRTIDPAVSYAPKELSMFLAEALSALEAP